MNDNDRRRELVAAVEYIAALARPDLTVTAAIDEALRWWHLLWDDPDPLRSTVDRLLAAVPASGLPGGYRVGGDRIRDRRVALCDGVGL